jgi:hypothetical protein
MKTLTRFLFAALLCTCAARAEVPGIVTGGFEAYKASGLKSALTTWLRGAQPSIAVVATSAIPPEPEAGSELTGIWGPMESFEILAVYSPSPRLRRVYAVAYTPAGPVFCRIDLCKSTGSWVTYDLRLNVSPDALLPVELIERTG